MGEGVARIVEVVGDRGGLEAQPVPGRPLGVVGVVVPLPLGGQGGGGELVGAGQRFDRVRGEVRERVVPGPGAACGPDLRPAVRGPVDRREGGHPAAGVGVDEGHVVPLAVRRVHQAALVGHAAAGDGSGQVEQQLAHLVGPERTRGRLEYVLAVRRPGQEDVVVAADAVEPGAFEHAGGLRGLEDRPVVDLGGHVAVQLRDADLGVAVRHVHAAVIVEQQPGVEIRLADLRVPPPGPLDGVGGVDVGPGEVDLPDPVEAVLAGAVVQRGGPDAAHVAASPVEVVLRPEVERGHRMPGELPVHQVP